MMTTDWFNITPTLSNKTYGTWVCACGVHHCVWLANTSQMNQGGAVSCMSCNTAVRYRHALLIPKLHKIHHFISCFYRSSWMALSLKRHVSDRMPAWGLEPIKVLTMHKTQKFVFQIILLNISYTSLTPLFIASNYTASIMCISAGKSSKVSNISLLST